MYIDDKHYDALMLALVADTENMVGLLNISVDYGGPVEYWVDHLWAAERAFRALCATRS